MSNETNATSATFAPNRVREQFEAMREASPDLVSLLETLAFEASITILDRDDETYPAKETLAGLFGYEMLDEDGEVDGDEIG